MTKKQTMEVLRRHGFWSGRMISVSKSGYRRQFRDHFVIFNAKILTRRDLVASGADLDLTLDTEKLTAAALEAGEDFFVLQECDPSPFWEPSGESIQQVIGNAVWWTRTQPENGDHFLPVPSARRRRSIRLHCRIGTLLGQPAYSVSCWDNDLVYNQNLTGSAVELMGIPPKGFITIKEAGEEKFSAAPSQSRGRIVRPVFYQRSGPLEYVWFSHGVSVSAVLYEQTVAPMRVNKFTAHSDAEAIHVHQAGKIVGLIWPNSYTPPHVAESARIQLRRYASERPN